MIYALLAVAMVLESSSPEPLPPLDREFRAVWIATVDNIDWPSKPGLPMAQQKQEMLKILDVCVANRLNAVIFQARPSADALYRSKFEPWSWFLSGEQGKAPDGDWDPLEFVVDEGHRRGLEVHVWCNPYRAVHPAQKGGLHESHLSRTDPAIVKTYGTYQWMDPGEPKVQQRSFDVFMDLVERYDIDGLHIDDYFYPYRVKDAAGNFVDFPDQPSYDRYRQAGGKLVRDDWRRKNVDDFIDRVYRGIKERKRWVKFGISPFGIYRPGVPEGIQAGVDQYAHLYADALKWYRLGWCDYFTPQLYWPIKQTPQSYPVLLNWWVEQNAAKRHLWPGNYTSRLNPKDGNWAPTELVDQIKLTRESGSAPGNVHFSMKAFVNDWNGINNALRSGVYRDPALIPASPWLGDGVPKAPRVKVEAVGDGWKVSVSPAGGETARFVVVRARRPDGSVSTAVTSSAEVQLVDAEYAEIRIQDRAGNVSDPTTVIRPGLR